MTNGNPSYHTDVSNSVRSCLTNTGVGQTVCQVNKVSQIGMSVLHLELLLFYSVGSDTADQHLITSSLERESNLCLTKPREVHLKII